MKRFIKNIISIIAAICLLFQTSLAREGDCGYEGGISSGQAPNKTSYEYQEVCFVTGAPMIMKGTLTIKKASRQDSKTKQEIITSTYTYDLKNADKSATLKRTLVYSTTVTQADNGQLIEETVFLRTPVEALRVGSQTYTLTNFDFTRTRITDTHPAANYHAGNLWGRKTYQAGTGTAAGTATVTVDIDGEFYGYDQYWGSTEVQTLEYYIQGEQTKTGFTDRWGGTAEVRLSSTAVKDLQYIENKPDQISFEGGYLQVQNNNSILEYESHLPEFDSNGLSTGHIVDLGSSLSLESFPVQTRLMVPSLDNLRGHPQEKEISLLYSLGIFNESQTTFKPGQYMTRAEFAAAIVKAAGEVPADPALANIFAAAVKTAARQPVSPFSDVSAAGGNFDAIREAFDRGIMSGDGNGNFRPDEYITKAEVIMVLIRAIGLENLAPGSNAVTLFKDNDQIPSYARKAAYVSEQTGLFTADDNGCINPNTRITKAEAAVILTRFIEYMRSDLVKDYRDRIVNY